MNRSFDFYEYAGVIVPGAVLVLGFLWLFPEGRAFFGKEGVTFGELGLFVIVAYAAGQLLQGVGNCIEWTWRTLTGGLPSQKILAGAYVTAGQYERICDALRTAVGVSDPAKLSPIAARSIAREVYSIVAAGGKAGRIDTFNGNFGLLRGLAAALLVLIIAAIALAKGPWIITALALLLVLALQRMHRFSKHYAIELFVQFLLVKGSQE